MPPVYPLPKGILINLLAAAVLGRKLSFHKLAVYCTGLLDPPLVVYGAEHVPARGGRVLTINHYTRAGFSTWWFPLTASSLVPGEVHWVQSNAWRMTGWQKPLSGVTRWLFPHIARSLGFFPMPPIPPDPRQVEQRARAVREVLAYARRNPQAIIGLAPEGSDEEDGCLKPPPPGTGRFMLQLARLGMDFQPVGFFEQGDTPCVRFGPAYRLSVPEGLSSDQRDRESARIVMTALAAQLPVELRGRYNDAYR